MESKRLFFSWLNSRKLDFFDFAEVDSLMIYLFIVLLKHCNSGPHDDKKKGLWLIVAIKHTILATKCPLEGLLWPQLLGKSQIIHQTNGMG